MGMDAGEGKPQKEKKGGLRHQKRRAGVRMDMTPMVDIAFLLLIFFMVTTVFRKPQAMEVNLPPKDAKVEVPESNVLTLYVRKDERMTYKVGTGAFLPTEKKELVSVYQDNLNLNPEIIILVKLHPKVRYEMMVDMMDELEIADMKRFSLVAMSEQEIVEIEAMP